MFFRRFKLKNIIKKVRDKIEKNTKQNNYKCVILNHFEIDFDFFKYFNQ